ncbi:hypothetical protein DFQ28_009073 [Apophysomyces sp. BC1034]|nr:hypothetical protein DFQ29_010078 [Apophysomyces sp. BC1021]KAG0192462.1 hypothetical protein DFQ28_009073 [Apophysomyces sp. BC1034]
MIGARNTINLQPNTSYKHEPLSGAGKIIIELMERDHRFLDLADLLRGPTSEKYVRSENIADECYIKSHEVYMPDDLLELVDREIYATDV